jgi:hypothetical protein
METIQCEFDPFRWSLLASFSKVSPISRQGGSEWRRSTRTLSRYEKCSEKKGAEPPNLNELR